MSEEHESWTKYQCPVCHESLTGHGPTLGADYEETLDPGIRKAVHVLTAANLTTFESCQSGEGHCFPEPTVRYYGGKEAGAQAYVALLQHGLGVSSIRQAWGVIEGVLDGPYWEAVFVSGRRQTAAVNTSGRPRPGPESRSFLPSEARRAQVASRVIRRLAEQLKGVKPS